MPDKDMAKLKIYNTMTPRILNDSIIGVLSKIPSNDLILPALFPNDPTLDYHNLSGCVHNGGEAMDIFPKMKNMSREEEQQTRKDLLQYCELDT